MILNFSSSARHVETLVCRPAPCSPGQEQQGVPKAWTQHLLQRTVESCGSNRPAPTRLTAGDPGHCGLTSCPLQTHCHGHHQYSADPWNSSHTVSHLKLSPRKAPSPRGFSGEPQKHLKKKWLQFCPFPPAKRRRECCRKQLIKLVLPWREAGHGNACTRHPSVPVRCSNPGQNSVTGPAASREDTAISGTADHADLTVKGPS